MKSEKLKVMQLVSTLTNILASWDSKSYNLARVKANDWLGEKPISPVEEKRIRKKAGPVAVVERNPDAPEPQPIQDESHTPRVINASVKTGLGLAGK